MYRIEGQWIYKKWNILANVRYSTSKNKPKCSLSKSIFHCTTRTLTKCPKVPFLGHHPMRYVFISHKQSQITFSHANTIMGGYEDKLCTENPKRQMKKDWFHISCVSVQYTYHKERKHITCIRLYPEGVTCHELGYFHKFDSLDCK